MIAGCLPIQIAGATLWMHPERALLWPAQDAVLVADTHFGKSQIFRHHGIPVPAGADGHDRERLRVLLRESGAARLFVLGDFFHGALEPGNFEIEALEAWLAQLAPVQLSVIAGNHDRHVLKHWQPACNWYTGSLRLGSVDLVHDAQEARGAARTGGTISGHIHPVWCGPRGRLNRLRAPVFWKTAAGLVLPSFGSLTGGYRVRPAPADELFVVADGAIIKVPRAGNATKVR